MLPIYDLPQAQTSILSRKQITPTVSPRLLAGISAIFGEPLSPEQAVSRILADVQTLGDAALRDYTARIDGVSLTDLQVPAHEFANALATLDPELRHSLQFSIERVRAFHQLQPVNSWETRTLGGRLGQKVTPLQRVGLYVPGGTAPLPSSLIMAAVPAQVAGVAEIVVCTPPDRTTGKVHPVILAAAALVGISKIFMLGGAQAIGAMAYGTQSVPRVDKIVGPGNLFVTLAKQKVFGQVGLDGLAGPTETLVIADDSANPAWVAADLLAQAEHDILASAILLTPSRTLAVKVQAEVQAQLAHLGRTHILEQSLSTNSGIVLVENLEIACQQANLYAPEHLCLAVAEPTRYAELLHNAGGIFIGERSFEVLGDYIAGPSHIMPTGGTARFASPVNVLDFVKIVSVIELDDATSRTISPHAARIARAESLSAHAAAADLRAHAPLPSEATPHAPAHRPHLRPHLADVTAYTPILPFEVLSQQLGYSPAEMVKLDANENPYGTSPKVRSALANLQFPHIYPDPESRFLRAGLADYTGLPSQYLLAGAGADELIDLILRVVAEPGDCILDCQPTFGMYPFDAEINNLRVLNVPRLPDFSLDLPKLLAMATAHQPRVLFVTSPNNPDGSILPDDTLKALLALPLLVVLDEAYIEFSKNPQGRIGWVQDYPNLVVLRTFSKWAGLAGLRVGYGAFPLWLIDALWKCKQPYNVSVAGQVAALAALQDLPFLQARLQMLLQERAVLFQQLQTIPYLTPYPSQANFILCRVAQPYLALQVKQELAKQGILIRHYQKAGLENCIRISVGTPAQSERVIAALRAIGT